MDKIYLTKDEVASLSGKKNLTLIEISALCEARLFHDEGIEQRVSWAQLKKAINDGHLPARQVPGGKGRRGAYLCKTEEVTKFYATRIVPQQVVPQKCG